ncbi:hypothetical protein CZ794_07570 [Psychrobacter sp. JB385]|nr:hypothetical protein CZ794_07570 [Psychrobacter sp. JB385]
MPFIPLSFLIIGHAAAQTNNRQMKSVLSQRIQHLCKHNFNGLKTTILLIS